MNQAVFYDRDGIIVQMVFDTENGTIDTVSKKEQVEFVPGIIELIKYTGKMGYKNIVISNQPRIGLKKIDKKRFFEIADFIDKKLRENNARIDYTYYCFHHPYAKVDEYRKTCDCRKPGAGLFFQANKDFEVVLKNSWMIGDGVNDILAGHRAGCKTILVGNLAESEYLRILERQLKGIKPDFIVKKVIDIKNIIV